MRNRFQFSKHLVMLILFCCVGSVHAGAKVYEPVKIFPILTDIIFYGAIGSARNSPNNVEYIFCKDWGNSATCTAKNAAGAVASCSTSNSTHLNVVRGLTDTSRIYVTYRAGTSTCGAVVGQNGSQYEPK